MSDKGLLPACMMPDGAAPCQAFTDQMDEIELLNGTILNAARDEIENEATIAQLRKDLAYWTAEDVK